MRIAHLSIAFLAAAFVAQPSLSFAQRRNLAPNDIADITTLIMLEDRREFDSTALARIMASQHPEVRRRAAQTLGRIVDPRARELLRAARRDADSAVAATIAWSTGQQYDTASIGWLDSLLNNAATPPTVAFEAAGALGKIRTAETRAILARYLSTAAMNSRNNSIAGEALLSIGRSTTRGDITPIVRWTTSNDPEVRWRATWALFRPRDPAAMQHLMKLTNDPSPLVRNWAVRGLSPAALDSAAINHATIVAQIAKLAGDPDRSVRTEAVRAMAAFPEPAAIDVMLTALANSDTWLSVSAAEGLPRHRQHAARTAPALVQQIRPGKSSALQIVSLTALNTLSPEHALIAATAAARDTSIPVRVAAVASLRARGNAARGVMEQLSNDAATEVSGPARAALTAIASADSAASAAARGGGAATSDAGGGAGGAGGGRNSARAGGGRPGGGGGQGRGRGPIQTNRTEADYRQIVERWIVADYNGAARPVAEWVTTRGSFRIELYPGDAPMGVADFFRNVESGALIGVDFSRLVPDFVAQQRGIPMHVTVRDEVSRKRLTRSNVSWASAGLDTGRPGYTLGHTPQPHNEGGFTALGRIISGMDVVDRLELGDKVVSARIIVGGR